MATINGIELDGRGAVTGAAFRLSTPLPVHFTYPASAGGTVHVAPHGAFVVAFYSFPFPKLDELLATSYDDVQKALDVLAITQHHFLSTPGAHHEHILWWNDECMRVLRYSVPAYQNVRAEISWVVKRASGTIESSADLPLPAWHEALRYFRYAHIRDDPYSSYRDAFLAIESVLSGYSSPKKGEREFDWHLRLNKELARLGLDFSGLTMSPMADPVRSFVEEQFKAYRCALSHAKVGESHYLPGALSDRQMVIGALGRLETYLTYLARKILGVQFPVTTVTFTGLREIIERFAHDLVLSVSEDPTLANKEDEAVSPAGFPVTTLETSFEGLADGTGYEYAFLGTVPVPNMESPLINTIAAQVSGDVVMRGDVPGLHLRGIDRVELRLIWCFTMDRDFRSAFTL
jgi:hypothetical protein